MDDSLFPLKIDIPDIDLKTICRGSYFKENSAWICFIFSHEENEEIKILNGKKIINFNLGEIEKNKKKFLIDYIEILESGDSTDISIEINNKVLFFKDIKLNGEQIFIFNNILLKDKNNNERQLNFFSSKELFEIYYKIHSEKNKNSMKFLCNSIINFCQKKDSDIDFSFFLTIFTKKHIKIESKAIEPILMNIKKIGDLIVISKKDLYHIVQENGNFLIIKLIYMLFQDVEELHKTMIDNKNAKQILFYYLEKMNAFLGSLALYPKYSFLIDISESIKEIKIVLKCSKNFCDLIDIINEKKHKISELLKKDKETIMIESYKIKDFYKIFDEKLYSTLTSINEFENESKIKLFDMADDKYFNYAEKYFSHFEFGNYMFILYLRNHININEFLKITFKINILNVFDLNNFSKIIFLDILLKNYSKIKKYFNIKQIILDIISNLYLKDMSKESKKNFLRINWENILEVFDFDKLKEIALFRDLIFKMFDSIDSIENLNL